MVIPSGWSRLVEGLEPIGSAVSVSTAVTWRRCLGFAEREGAGDYFDIEEPIQLTGGWQVGDTLQCLDCHAAHMESNRNLFHLRDAPRAKDGTPLASNIGSTGFNYRYWENWAGNNTPDSERGHDWCYTCHLVDSAMDGKGECVGGGHKHGSAKF